MLDFLVDLFYKLLDTLANLGDAFQLLLVPAFLYLFIIRPIHKHWKSHSLQVQHQRRSPNTAQIQEIGFTPVPERNDELEVLCHKAGVSPTGLHYSTGHFTISRAAELQEREMKLTVFDALFTGDASDFLGDGPDRRLSHIHLFNTDAQTILLMEDFGIIPDFSLFPETLADKIMDIFAKMDIDFSDTPVFSDMFFLSGEEYARNSISRFFTYGLRKFLESKKDLCMVSRDSKILIFRRNVLLNDDGVRKLMDIAHNLHRLVLSKYGIRA